MDVHDSISVVPAGASIVGLMPARSFGWAK
jgi:hypothetical protein